MKKIDYLEGVRGLAAFLVFFHHFFLAFYPSHYYGDPATTHAPGYDLQYYSSPITFLFNGNFMVCIFFILSGYVLSRKYFMDRNWERLISAAGRRFLRLYLPVAAALIISYLCIRFSLYYNTEASVPGHSRFLEHLLKEKPGFVGFMQELLYKTMFWGSNALDSTVWSISVELYGSFLVFGFLLFTHRMKNKMLLTAVLIIVLFTSFSKYYIAFMLGISFNLIAELRWHEKLRDRNLFLLPLFVIGLLMGGFPSTGVVQGTFYSFMNVPVLAKNFILIHIAGAFLVIYAIMFSSVLQRIFSNFVFIFLGRISYALYLLHPILIGTFSCYVFLLLGDSVASYNTLVLLVFVLSLALCVGVSYIFTVYVDDKSVKYSKVFYEKYLRSETDSGEIK
jgi:peptidoglycan/LPS O-acetylase OafA/YrhL